MEKVAGASVVVKIGGSACTHKSQFETLNEEGLNGACSQLAALWKEGRQSGISVAVVHGAGSFGHQQARQYAISAGADDAGGGGASMMPESKQIGFAKTRLSVTTLNKHILTRLIDYGVPATTLSPFPCVATRKKSLMNAQLPPPVVASIRGLLSRGLVPVVHGDAVLDEAQGCAILSGDVWMVELCRELGSTTAVFLTDVDGVFTAPPSDPSAQLISEILLDVASGELELTGVSMSCDGRHDVTGGLKTKLDCAARILMEAASVEVVFIVKTGSEAAAEAMRGRTPALGTALRRKS
mmetsp:Transcript_70581/g.132074  ORF Transcript_70581/g.132074 Transcript_70581/m.132074 type:complete len:297 (+) Transcript_70581:32-922(+)